MNLCFARDRALGSTPLGRWSQHKQLGPIAGFSTFSSRLMLPKEARYEGNSRRQRRFCNAKVCLLRARLYTEFHRSDRESE